MSNLKRQENLTDKQMNILRSEMDDHRKSTGISYLLYVFIGSIGIHKFYLGKWKMGIFYALLTIGGWSLGGFSFLGAMVGASDTDIGGALILGMLMLLAVGILLFIDLFTIPRQIRKTHEKLKDGIISEFED